MAQPSSLDVNLPEHSLLFPARSSPFVCIADALDVIIDLSIYTYKEGSVRQAAKLVNWRIARRRLGDDVVELEESAGEKHPKSFLLLFVVALLQAIKMIGLQGVFWTQAWTGIYLCSYGVMAILRILPPRGWRSQSPPIIHEMRWTNVVSFVLFSLAGVCHFCVVTGVLFRVSCLGQLLEPEPQLDGWVDPEPFPLVVFFFCGALLSSMFWGSTAFFISTTSMVLLMLSEVGASSPQRLEALGRWCNTCNWKLLVVLFSFISPAIIFGISAKWYLPLEQGFVARHAACSMLFNMFVLLPQGFLSAFRDVEICVRFFSSLRMPSGIHRYMIAFPFINFLVSFLYYRTIYDPKLTYKPSWTENIG